MKTIHRHLVYAVLMLALLASPAMGWSIEASFASWSGDYGYYPYEYYPAYYSTVYTPSVYPDVVYPTVQQHTTNVIYVQQSQPYHDNTNVVYQPPADYSQATTSASQNSCGDGWCSSTETQQSCPADCTPVSYCGDGACNNGETSISCSYDCKVATPVSTRPVPYCGDKRCNDGETKYSCPADCGLPAYCGDGTCNGAETKYNCPQDCGLASYCGDGTCDRDETKYNCVTDCGLAPYCGNGKCDNTETKYSCPLDCGNPKCARPTGEEADEICRNREILICDDGLWDFKKSVQCCVNTDCEDGYKCEYNRCVLKSQVAYTYSRPAQPAYYCGDGSCSNGETCVTCKTDCGLCYSCGDGVCNLQTESRDSCPQDCGEPARHLIELSSTDECFEVEQGSTGNFTLMAYNAGNALERLTLSATGQAADWTGQQPSITVSSGATSEWQMIVNVPANTEPGLYNITVWAQNSNIRESTVLHIDVKLPPMENGTSLVPTLTGGNANETSTPTGALVVGELAIPDWALVLAVLLVAGAFLIFLLNKTSKVAGPVIATDGGSRLPAWATKGG
jgi:hypothetical protein